MASFEFFLDLDLEQRLILICRLDIFYTNLSLVILNYLHYGRSNFNKISAAPAWMAESSHSFTFFLLELSFTASVWSSLECLRTEQRCVGGSISTRAFVAPSEPNENLEHCVHVTVSKLLLPQILVCCCYRVMPSSSLRITSRWKLEFTLRDNYYCSSSAVAFETSANALRPHRRKITHRVWRRYKKNPAREREYCRIVASGLRLGEFFLFSLRFVTSLTLMSQSVRLYK